MRARSANPPAVGAKPRARLTSTEANWRSSAPGRTNPHTGPDGAEARSSEEPAEQDWQSVGDINLTAAFLPARWPGGARYSGHPDRFRPPAPWRPAIPDWRGLGNVLERTMNHDPSTQSSEHPVQSRPIPGYLRQRHSATAAQTRYATRETIPDPRLGPPMDGVRHPSDVLLPIEERRPVCRTAGVLLGTRHPGGYSVISCPRIPPMQPGAPCRQRPLLPSHSAVEPGEQPIRPEETRSADPPGAGDGTTSPARGIAVGRQVADTPAELPMQPGKRPRRLAG